MNKETFDKVAGQSADMLRAALADDWDGAQETAQAIAAESGMGGFFLMLTALADWTVQAQARAAGREMPTQGSLGCPAWKDPDSGTLTFDAREVDEAERWAGQFLTARAVMDHDMTQALYENLPAQCGKHVQALVETCAESVKLAGSAS